MEPGLAQWKTLRGFPRYARTSAGSRPWAAPTGSGRARLDHPLSPWERAGVRALQRGGIPPLGFAALNPTYAVDLGRRGDNGAALSTNGAGACLVENAARFSTLRQDIGWIAAMGRSYGKRSRQARPPPIPLGEGWGEGAPAQRYPRSWASLRSTQPTRSISAVGWITAQPYPRMEPGLPSGKRCAVFHATPGHRLDRGHGPLLREAVAPGLTAPSPSGRGLG